MTISDISLDKKTFSSDKETGVQIRYKISKDAAVSINIYNDEDLPVRQVIKNSRLSAGSHVAEWDGKDDRGDRLSSGIYIYTIEAESSDGNKERYDPADETGGLLLTVRKPILDTEKGEISYVMPKAGMVRIRGRYKVRGFAENID